MIPQLPNSGDTILFLWQYLAISCINWHYYQHGVFMKILLTILIGLGLFCGVAFAATKTMGTKTLSGEEFLAANKHKHGVVTLPDGLQYRIIKQGAGAKPTMNDTVTVNYEGTLVGGTIFDSSYKRGEPATFPVSGVIPGWTEALQLMPVGSTWMLYIPANLAYGETGAPPAIGPNEVLIFKVELLNIQK
jgi:FKBP-type peptidyl-prolyl cis-trans isomerase FklB